MKVSTKITFVPGQTPKMHLLMDQMGGKMQILEYPQKATRLLDVETHLWQCEEKKDGL